MFKKMPALILVACLFYQTQELKLNRITVYTPHSSNIVFEYAYEFLSEEEPIKSDNVNMLRSQLLATGLFTEIKIEVYQIKDTDRADINIYPTWKPQPKSFVIDKIVFNGFSEIDEDKVREGLKRKKIAPGSLLLEHSPQQIRQSLYDTIEEIYKNDSNAMSDFEKQVKDSSFRIEPTTPGRFKLTISTTP
jgi:hypothetical protein